MKIRAALVVLLVLAVFVTGVVAKSQSNLLRTLEGSPNHKTLVKLIKDAGLTKTFEGTTSYTVFAPTDAAFAKIPKATLDSLMKPANKAKLKGILAYHVVKGKMTAKNLLAMKSPITLTSLNGAKLGVTHTKNAITVGGARVTGSEMDASNGVVHSIDKVLTPPVK